MLPSVWKNKFCLVSWFCSYNSSTSEASAYDFAFALFYVAFLLKKLIWPPMREWKRRVAPSGGGDCFPASAAFGREGWCCRSEREREKMSQGGTDTHQMISCKGTLTKLRNGDRITLGNCREKKHAFRKTVSRCDTGTTWSCVSDFMAVYPKYRKNINY